MSDTIYCYPHSNVLMNKLKITEPEELQNAEIEMTSNYLYALQLQPIKGKFDFKHLCAIHKHIFQDLYPWAGQPRTVNIGKGNLFCLVQHIQTYADSIFSGYYKDCMTVKENPDEFIHTLTNYYSGVNALHPFREGNGRSQREFARELCLKCGYVFDLTQTNHENMLSLGDYGRTNNVKAQFLGLNKDIDGVANGECMPLEEKWVVTLSTQYGCNSACKFCDVPKVGRGINATYNDMKEQIESALSLHPEVGSTKRLNIHYARMDEPSWNPDVLKLSYDLHKIVRPYIGNSLIHPVFTTMCPNKNRKLFSMLQEWTNDIKNDLFRGDAGLQLSINSTSEEQRHDMFSGNACTLDEISAMVRDLPMPKGRKYALNFALADNYEVDAKKLRELFSPNKCMVKITPLHMTHSCTENDIKTSDGYTSFVPYQKAEKDLIDAGFDVLIFVPSSDEDRGRITCGNAILSGSLPECRYRER